MGIADSTSTNQTRSGNPEARKGRQAPCRTPTSVVCRLFGKTEQFKALTLQLMNKIPQSCQRDRGRGAEGAPLAKGTCTGWKVQAGAACNRTSVGQTFFKPKKKSSLGSTFLPVASRPQQGGHHNACCSQLQGALILQGPSLHPQCSHPRSLQRFYLAH